MDDRITKLEATLERLRDKSVVAMAKIGLNPDTLAPDNGLFKRIEKIEHDIAEIKQALVGNVTAKVLKNWLIGASAVVSAILALFGVLLKITGG